LTEPDGLLSGSGNIIEKALLTIYNKKVNVMKEIEPNLFNITYKQLNLSVDNEFAKVRFNNPNPDFIHELKYNNAVFSAFKTHRQQNDLAANLLDIEGKLKSFQNFKKDTEKIIGKYNQDWLKTEYNTAVIRARQAANFKKFEEDIDLYPNLKWLQSTSVERRAGHVPFYNLIKPLNDPFWSNNYPGNLWNCKCGITNTDEEPDKTTPKSNYKPSDGIDENPGITGKIFTKTHPYRTDGYLSPLKLDKIATSKADEVAYKQSIVKVYKNGGKVIESNLVNKVADDYKSLLKIANQFAKESKMVELLPKVHYKDSLYKELFKGAFERKCPDLKIDGSFYEFESYIGDWNKNKISNMLNKGLKQSDKVIIDIIGGYAKDDYIKRIALDMIKHKVKVSEIWVLECKNKIRRVF
jgi:hypothetical protein